MLLVRKKDGTFRFCIDFRKLNEVTMRDCYPMPRPDDTLDKLAGAAFFTVLDLAAGYWQIPLKEEDKQKTAFAVAGELYESNVLAMGLTNAPATFQRAMNDLFRNMLGKSVLVYIDDLIVFSASWEEHVVHVRRVLQMMRDANLKAKITKCHFGMKEVTYLGHLVGVGGIRPERGKWRPLRRCRRPETPKR